MYCLKKVYIDFEVLKIACINTFKYRSSEFYIDNILNVLINLKTESDLQKNWINYQKSFSYVENIKFDDAIDTIIELVNHIK